MDKRIILLVIIILFAVTIFYFAIYKSVGEFFRTPTPTFTLPNKATPTFTPIPTFTHTPTLTFTATSTATQTFTPCPTSTNTFAPLRPPTKEPKDNNGGGQPTEDPFATPGNE